MNNWKEHIVTDSNVLLWKPVVKGTRLSIEFILERLASGWDVEELLENYPNLTKEDTQAVHSYRVLQS